MRNLFFVILPVLLWPKISIGKDHSHPNYIDYNKRITIISILIFEHHEKEALQKFDSLYRKFDFVFAKDLYMGLQLASKLKETKLGFIYLKKSIEQGITRKLISSDSLVANLKKLDPGRWNQIFLKYDSLHKAYKTHHQPALRTFIDSVYEKDQELTNKLNNSMPLRPYYWIRWNRQNKRHAKMLFQIMHEKGYPGERQLGLSTLSHLEKIKNVRYGTNCFISYHKTLFILIHYFSKRRDDANDLFLKCVKDGSMSAYEYAVLNDFMARWGKKRYKRNYFDVWQNAPLKLTDIVNGNRKMLGFCDLTTRKKYRQYWAKVKEDKQEPFQIFLPALYY